MSTEPAANVAASVDGAVSHLLPRCTFAPPGTAVVCAMSGGADSTALVALAVAADLVVSAVHVDHGLRPTSADDVDLAATTAAHFNVPFRSVRVDLGDGPNLEARARRARHTAIGVGALTGHTADDQAETLLLSLLRGAGAAGLGAMQPGPTKPILAIRRNETRALCADLGLVVADDPTNTDRRFRRNRLRLDVIPMLDDVAQRDVVPLLARTSGLLRDDDELLAELASALDPTDARALAAAPLPLARRAVRQWIIESINTVDRHPPNAATVERVLAVARGDAVGCDVAEGWRVERSRQELRLFSRAPTSR